MKINVYNGKEIEKTYFADDYKLMFGTLEDLIDAIDIDALDSSSEIDLAKAVAGFISNSRVTAKNIIKDMFPEITDEELRRVATDEMAICLIDAVKYVFAQVKKIAKRKN